MKLRILFLIAICFSFVLVLSVEAQQRKNQRSTQRKESQPKQSSKQPVQPPTIQKDGIEYSVLSIERKGQSMPYGNATISAPEGQEVVELKLRVKPVAGGSCCHVFDFELETVEGQKADPVWGDMKSSEAKTFALQFITAIGSKFKVFKVSGAAIAVGTLPSEKSKP